MREGGRVLLSRLALSSPMTIASRESGILSTEKLCFKTRSLSVGAVTSRGGGEGGKTSRNGLLPVRAPPAVSSQRLRLSSRQRSRVATTTNRQTSGHAAISTVF